MELNSEAFLFFNKGDPSYTSCVGDRNSYCKEIAVVETIVQLHFLFFNDFVLPWVVTNQSAAKTISIVLAGHMTQFTCATSSFFHVNSNGPIRKQQPPTTPQVTGRDRTARPEVDKNYIWKRNHFFGLMQSRMHTLSTSGTCVMSRPPFIYKSNKRSASAPIFS